MRWSIERDMVVRRIGSGPELVWIHGLGEQSSSFDAIVRRLVEPVPPRRDSQPRLARDESDRPAPRAGSDGDAGPDPSPAGFPRAATPAPSRLAFTHVLVDLPGYGRSAWPERVPDGDSLAHLADHLASWLTGPAVLVGHSMGGVLATLVAERTPMRAIVNIDGNLSRGDCTFSAEAASYAPDGFALHGFDHLRDAVYQRGVTEPALRGYHAGLRAACPEVFHRNSIDLVALSSGETLAGRLAALGIPALFVAGAPGGICERSRSLLERERIRTVAIEPSGHWPFIDRPEPFAIAITEFLETLDSAA